MTRFNITVKDNETGGVREIEVENFFMFGRPEEDRIIHYVENITYEDIAIGIDSFRADHPDLVRAQTAITIAKLMDAASSKMGGNKNA